MKNKRPRRARYRRRSQIESLEPRQLLYGGIEIGHSSLQEPPPNGSVDETAAAVHAPPFPLSETFQLASRPGAEHTIYLDFDGHTTQNTRWNDDFNGGAAFTSPAYDIEGDSSAFSDEELTRIQRIWLRVQEDFLPFEVNVTTDEPPLHQLIKQNSINQHSGDQWGVRVVIGEGSWYPGDAGGVGYVRSFNWNSDTPVFVFNFSEAGVAEVISHEAGHALGLSHDGQNSQEYYEGHGDGQTGWAPIMGDAPGRHLTQWSKGEYSGANQTQDDLSIITSNNGFDYRADDHGDTSAQATLLTVDLNQHIAAEGIIEQNSDVDVFSFSLTAPLLYGINVEPAFLGANLDVRAQLYDSNNQLLADVNPPDQLYSRIRLPLDAGDYSLHVEGAGKGDVLEDGYSDYGSLGAYSVLAGPAAASIPFAEDWESGRLAPYWELQSSADGRIQVTSEGQPYGGEFHVALDNAAENSASATNQLILHIDLEGLTDATLRFANREYDDENHVQDSVQVSVDSGTSWHQVTSLTGSRSTNTYTQRMFSLGTLGLVFTSDTWIRFQQHDNQSLDFGDDPLTNWASDGMTFDDIAVEAPDSLDVSISADAIAENAGASATTVTVRRAGADLDQPLSVSLSTSDATEAAVPETVVIPAGAASATFALGAVNDMLVDGSQSVTITASSEGFVSGQANLVVHDNDRWGHNVDSPLDINANGIINNEDALLVISLLRNAGGGGPLSELDLDLQNPPRFPDVNDDALFTTVDTLMVISHLRENSQIEFAKRAAAAEGESDQQVADLDWRRAGLTSQASEDHLARFVKTRLPRNRRRPVG